MKTNLTLLGIACAVLFASCSRQELSPNGKPGSNEEFAKAGQQRTTTYVGQAAGLNTTVTTIQNGVVTSNQTLLAETGLLPLTGGSLSATQALANVQNIVTAETLNASTTGQNGQVLSQASATNFTVTSNGHVIAASGVSSSATSTCGGVTGSTQIQNLVIDGTPVVVTGAANQVIFLQGGGFVVINEQALGKGKSRNITVSGLRVVIPNAVDARVAVARAEVKC